MKLDGEKLIRWLLERIDVNDKIVRDKTGLDPVGNATCGGAISAYGRVISAIERGDFDYEE